MNYAEHRATLEVAHEAGLIGAFEISQDGTDILCQAPNYLTLAPEGLAALLRFAELYRRTVEG